MSLFLMDPELLWGVKPESLADLLNSLVRAKFKKGEVAAKLWAIFGLDKQLMCNETFYWSVDLGIISRKESVMHKYNIKIGENYYRGSLPEMDVIPPDVNLPPEHYRANNWELFKLIRKTYGFSHKNAGGVNEPQTTYLYKDDLEQLMNTFQSPGFLAKYLRAAKLIGKMYLYEAAFYGSLACFQILISCGNKPDVFTLKGACQSGNKDIIQIILSKGVKPTADCLSAAITHWNNRVAKWMIDGLGHSSTLHDACESGNVIFVYYLFYIKKESIHDKDDVQNLY